MLYKTYEASLNMKYDHCQYIYNYKFHCLIKKCFALGIYGNFLMLIFLIYYNFPCTIFMKFLVSILEKSTHNLLGLI